MRYSLLEEFSIAMMRHARKSEALGYASLLVGTVGKFDLSRTETMSAHYLMKTMFFLSSERKISREFSLESNKTEGFYKNKLWLAKRSISFVASRF